MKIALLGGLPKASGDLAPWLTPEPGPAGERVSLHGWTLEVEFNDHPSIPSLARSMLSCSVPPSLPPSLSLAAAAAQNHILGFKDLASVARRGARRGGRRRLVSPCVGRVRGGQIVPRGRNPANEGGRVASVRVWPVARSLSSASRNCFITRILWTSARPLPNLEVTTRGLRAGWRAAGSFGGVSLIVKA